MCEEACLYSWTVVKLVPKIPDCLWGVSPCLCAATEQSVSSRRSLEGASCNMDSQSLGLATKASCPRCFFLLQTAIFCPCCNLIHNT